jgi:hypothetical protein
LALKAEGIKIERLDESIDRPSRIVLINKVFEACRQKRRLCAIRAFDEPAHEKPPALEVARCHDLAFSHSLTALSP